MAPRVASFGHYLPDCVRGDEWDAAPVAGGFRAAPGMTVDTAGPHDVSVAFRAMVAAMSKLTGPVAAIAEISRMGDENLGSWLREYEGYRGTLVFVDDDANTARLITLWDTRGRRGTGARVPRGDA